MKRSVITNATLIPVSNTVFTDIESFDIRKLYAIINQTTGQLIYATSTPGLGYTGTPSDPLTLEFDISAMSATDVVQIIYEDVAEASWLENIYYSIDSLKFLAGVRGTLSDLRVTQTGTVNIAGSITNANQGSYSANNQVPAIMNTTAQLMNINNIQITL